MQVICTMTLQLCSKTFFVFIHAVIRYIFKQAILPYFSMSTEISIAIDEIVKENLLVVELIN